MFCARICQCVVRWFRKFGSLVDGVRVDVTWTSKGEMNERAEDLCWWPQYSRMMISQCLKETGVMVEDIMLVLLALLKYQNSESIMFHPSKSLCAKSILVQWEDQSTTRSS